MNKSAKIITASLLALTHTAISSAGLDNRTLNIFDGVVFHDGYNSEIIDSGIEDGVLRISNYRYSKKLTEEELNWPGEDLKMNVTVGALCDNYDRTGSVSLALVEKGVSTYDPETTDRIELGRFITPFMNKNKQPDSVNYEFDVPGLSLIMRDRLLREKYDLWIELEIFGIPYTANKMIKGCEGHTDVFRGSLSFESSSAPADLTNDCFLLPITIKLSENHGSKNFNSYTEGSCDRLGIPEKTYSFSLPEDLNDSRLMLITSSHGADEYGEEYYRRHHFLFFDDEPVFDFTPGGEDCEPYRVYNTQPNGIYGKEPDYDFWYNYSNWCPGQALPVREVHIGALNSGDHSFKLSVPDAEFYDNKGEIRVSAYLLGARKGIVPADKNEISDASPLGIRMEGRRMVFVGNEEIKEAEIFSPDCRLIFGKYNPGDSLMLDRFSPGVYIVSVRDIRGKTTVAKILLE